MKKQEFYLDKGKKINSVIFKLAMLNNKNFPRDSESKISNQEMAKWRKLSEELLKQVHELNAGRNIFNDND